MKFDGIDRLSVRSRPNFGEKVVASAFEALKARGGGAGNTSVLRTDKRSWTVRDIGEATSGDRDALSSKVTSSSACPYTAVHGVGTCSASS